MHVNAGNNFKYYKYVYCSYTCSNSVKYLNNIISHIYSVQSIDNYVHYTTIHANNDKNRGNYVNQHVNYRRNHVHCNVY